MQWFVEEKNYFIDLRQSVCSLFSRFFVVNTDRYCIRAQVVFFLVQIQGWIKSRLFGIFMPDSFIAKRDWIDGFTTQRDWIGSPQFLLVTYRFGTIGMVLLTQASFTEQMWKNVCWSSFTFSVKFENVKQAILGEVFTDFKKMID